MENKFSLYFKPYRNVCDILKRILSFRKYVHYIVKMFTQCKKCAHSKKNVFQPFKKCSMCI